MIHRRRAARRERAVRPRSRFADSPAALGALAWCGVALGAGGCQTPPAAAPPTAPAALAAPAVPPAAELDDRTNDAPATQAAIQADIRPDNQADSQADDPATAGFERPDLSRDTGMMLRRMGDSRWGIRARLPVSVGITDFDFDGDLSLDSLTTISFVPLVEFPIALDERWTLLPYTGLGGAYQTGDRTLIGGTRFLALYRAGLNVQRWQPFGERYAYLAKAELRYDAVLSRRDGLLGDWGSVDGGVELRAVLGQPGDGARFQPGIYIQGVHFWQAVKLELDGVAPRFIDDQLELGVSAGTNVPYKVAGLTLPRMFVGLRVGDALRGLYIRFGRL